MGRETIIFSEEEAGEAVLKHARLGSGNLDDAQVKKSEWRTNNEDWFVTLVFLTTSEDEVLLYFLVKQDGEVKKAG